MDNTAIVRNSLGKAQQNRLNINVINIEIIFNLLLRCLLFILLLTLSTGEKIHIKKNEINNKIIRT